MSLNIVSTTDSPEAVKAALGDLTSKKDEGKEAKSAPAEKEQEQKEAPESDTEGKDAKGETESESQEDEGSETDQPKKNKGGFQRRIDKLNAKKSEAERERDYWRAEALKSQKPAGGDEKPKEADAKVEGEPDPEKFETHAAYVKALTKWEVDNRVKADKDEQAKSKLLTEHKTAVQAYTDRESAFVKEHKDYHETLAEVDDIPVSAAMHEIILSSENGPALVYELAKNRDELERISKLAPLAASRALGMIEARISKVSEESKPEPKKLTKAPEPPKPVGSKGTVSDPLRDDAPYQEWKAAREAQLRKRR